MRIESKADFYDKWEKGLLGNKPRTWSSLTDLVGSRYAGTVSMRYKGDAGGGFCAYNVDVSQASAVEADWCRKGAHPLLITYNESAPDEVLVAQGEVMRGEQGLTIRYSTFKGKMRDAMAHASHLYGLMAKLYLTAIMTPASYDDLETLMYLYPDSVIEFSTYGKDVGDSVGRNTIIWEVRNY